MKGMCPNCGKIIIFESIGSSIEKDTDRKFNEYSSECKDCKLKIKTTTIKNENW